MKSQLTSCFMILASLLSCKQTNNDSNIALKQRSPNILFIMSDDHTSQAWGLYGGVLKDHVKNNHIKRLASEGVLLNNVFCTNSICVPSRATILTGQYSHENNVFTLADSLQPQQDNIAKHIKQAGYQTALIGKWHLKAEPAGFDYYNVLSRQGHYWDPTMRTKDNFHEPVESWQQYKGFSTDIITDLSIDWLKERDKDKPFMLMTHFKATHEPFDFPERHNELYKNEAIPEPESLLDFFETDNSRTINGQNLENLIWRWQEASKDPEAWWCQYPELPFSVKGLDADAARKKAYQKLVKDFMRSGAAVNDNIGKLLDYLDTSGLADNTVVIYTSDQGYFLGEHGWFDKRLMYEESLRMPFVIRYPKEIKGGGTLDAMVLNTDFASLFADYAGVNLPDTFKGKSFRNQLSNTKTTSRDAVYYRYWMHHPDRPAHLGIRTEQYKLILFYGNGLDKNGADKTNSPVSWELYDLKNDPQERRNLYDDPSYKTLLKELKQELYELKIQENDLDNEYPWINELLTS